MMNVSLLLLCWQRDLDFIIEVSFDGQYSSKASLMRYKMR